MDSYHNHCRCVAVPVFTAYEPSAQVREWQTLYQNSTKGVHGPEAMRKAFRQAYEGRTVTAAKDTTPVVAKDAAGKVVLSPEQVAHQIKTLEGAPAPKGSKAEAWQKKRLAYLRSL